MLIILPTDTCYGLAGEFSREDFDMINTLKGRDDTKRLAMLVEDFEDMKKYVIISDEQIAFLRSYPHPWSFLGVRNLDFNLPEWMDASKYERISLRVAKVCIKSPPDKGGRGVSYIPYRADLTKKAQENRKNMNIQERKVWYEILRSGELQKYRFQRQKPLGEYIVDFYSQELVLVIEIDGESHLDQGYYDAKRTKFLELYGLHVMRFSNEEVLENPEGVYERIYEYIHLRNQPPISPLIMGAEPTSHIPPYHGGGTNLPYPPLSGGRFQYPLFLTSANLSGQSESTTLEEAQKIFPQIGGIDGGICDRPPSDIFSIGEDGEIVYLRRNYR